MEVAQFITLKVFIYKFSNLSWPQFLCFIEWWHIVLWRWPLSWQDQLHLQLQQVVLLVMGMSSSRPLVNHLCMIRKSFLLFECFLHIVWDFVWIIRGLRRMSSRDHLHMILLCRRLLGIHLVLVVEMIQLMLMLRVRKVSFCLFIIFNYNSFN